MGTQGLHAAFVFVVPDPQSFVISTAHNKLPSGVHEYTAHPIIVADLQKHQTKRLQTNSDKNRIISEEQSHSPPQRIAAVSLKLSPGS